MPSPWGLPEEPVLAPLEYKGFLVIAHDTDVVGIEMTISRA